MQPGQIIDEGLIVTFRMDSVPDEKATEANGGVPHFKDVPFVNIRIPGNKDEIIDVEAWTDKNHPMSHVRRFPHAWALFQSDQRGDDGVKGIRLKECNWVARSQVDYLASWHIKTVEQLASVSDDNLQKITHGLELRTKAQAFLKEMNSGAAMRAELEELKAKLAALTGPSQPAHVKVIPPQAEAQVVGAREAPEVSAPAQAPKRRGRPPKASQVNP